MKISIAILCVLILASCESQNVRYVINNSKEIFPAEANEVTMNSVRDECTHNDKAYSLLSSYWTEERPGKEELILLSFYPDRYGMSGAYVYSLLCGDISCEAYISWGGEMDGELHGEFIKSEIRQIIDSEFSNPTYQPEKAFVHNRCYVLINNPRSNPEVFVITDNLSDGAMGNRLLQALLAER